ncbi:MAG TPA: acylphosphatase [Nocardioides sp.]|nr:acylphosphatase [Nocardioides sp.]
MKAVEVRVTGRVQGVFFRASCADEARRLGVRGWVTNEPDGSVRGYFVGEPGAVDALVGWCDRGPRGARVEGVDVRSADVRDARGFEAR